jgi:long-chain acyl-CoA synthetase
MAEEHMTETARALPPWPAMSIAEAHAVLTAPGAPFEMEVIAPQGRPVRAWKGGPRTLVELAMIAKGYGQRTFMVHEAERISYDAFFRAAHAFAVDLIARGVQPGDRVAIVMRNLPEWPVVFFGAAMAGAVVTPLNAWWTGAELAYGLHHSGAVAAVFDAQRFDRVADRLAGLTDLRHIFLTRAGEATTPRSVDEEIVSLEARLGPPSAWGDLPNAIDPPRAASPEANAALFYTSGTTGRPKGASATHRAATTPILATRLSQARAYLRRGEPLPTPSPDAPQKRRLVCIPFFHVTGCLSHLNGAMALGAMLIVMRRWDPQDAMALIERERATGLGGVPTIAWQLLEHPARDRYDLSSLETITYGGAPAPPELVRRLRQDLPRVAVGCGWGMTETCATFTHHVGEDYARRPDSCGPATPVGELRVVGADGETLAPGRVGELWAYGPHVVTGYWNDPEATAETFHDGWVKTGDLARLDEEGFCYIIDRIKDVIIRGGENIYSVEVEDALYTHPAVMDAAVAPIPHPTLGEEPGAVVTLKPGAQASEAELKAHVAARLAAFKTPVRVVMSHDPLPRNANGKILKTELCALLVEAPT